MLYSLQKISDISFESGVYLFKNVQDEVLYVGKATNLRSRVRQYFSGAETKSRGERIRQLIVQIASIETMTTESVLEALILEASLIKQYQPKYNILEKDDKSFSYFIITKEKFPRVVIVRQTDLHKAKYQDAVYARGKIFGPYTSRAQMNIALKILRKIFPFHDRAEQSEKGCLAYQIGLCPGPYAPANAISPEEYQKNIRGIRMVLSGKRKRLLTTIRKEMYHAAQNEQFELATKLRNQILALEHINDVALMTGDFAQNVGADNSMRVECFDVSHLAGSQTVAAMVVANGNHLNSAEYRTFIVRNHANGDDLMAMREVLERRLAHIADWGRPDAIVLDGGATHLAMAEELWKSLGATIPLLAVAKGPTRKKVDVYPSHRYPPAEEIVSDTKRLEQLREEAHRVAITFHRKRRKKEFLD